MLFLRFALVALTSGANKPKHVVFMFADDLGWDDVSFHGSTQIPTPAIDTLAHDGVILNQYYVQPVCSPTRATFMTGRHVIHNGVYTAFGQDSAGDLSLNFTLLPQHMAALGYSTHMVGKWHLGFSDPKFTPLQRGFDSFIGYLGGAQDYWIHGFSDTSVGHYLDFTDGGQPAFNYTCWDDNACPVNTYSTHIFAKRAVEIIEASADSGKPLFLYLAWQGVHTVEGPDPEQLKAPQSYIDAFNTTVTNDQRRVFAAMTHALDEGVANVTAALKRVGMYDDTLIIFSTDNGGPADGLDRNMASNWPLRGTKCTLFEGGIRGVGLVSGGALNPQRRGQVLDGLIHVSDWLPTLLTFAARGATGSSTATWQQNVRLKDGEPPFAVGDGQDLLDYIAGDVSHSPRKEVLHEAHPQGSMEGVGNALRIDDWKIVLRTGKSWPKRGTLIENADGWFGGPNSSDSNTDGYALPAGAKDQNWTVKCSPPPANISLSFPCEQLQGEGADKIEFACLFNVREDPCEQVDRSRSNPVDLQRLFDRLEVFRSSAVDGASATRNPDGHTCPMVRTITGCTGAGAREPMNCSAKLPCATSLLV